MNKFLATLLIGFSFISLPSWGVDDYQWGFDYQFGLVDYYKRDYQNALRTWTPLAEKGHAQAQSKLGYMYSQGYGVSQDYKTAVKWTMLAAEQGDEDAQYRLGYHYFKGLGVLKDDVYAHMWWNITSSNGSEDGRRKREEVAKQMTPSQIEKAQDLARECIAKDYKNC